MNQQRRGRSVFVGSVLAVVLAAGSAIAQPENAPPLRGPRVERDADQGTQRFTRGQRPGEARAGDQPVLPPQALARLIRVLDSDAVEPELRLTQEQKDRIAAIHAAHAEAASKYINEHRAEIVQHLRDAGQEQLATRIENAEGLDMQGFDRVNERLRESFRGGDRPVRRRAQGENGDAMMEPPALTDKQREALRGLAEIRRQGPGADLQRELGGVLTEAQRNWVRARMERLASDRPGFLENRPDQMQPGAPGAEGVRRPDGQPPRRGRLNDRPDGELMPMPMSPPPEAGKVVVRSPRLARILENMSPEEQERLAEMIEQIRNRRGGQGGQPRRAPDMDSVNVPPPDGSM